MEASVDNRRQWRHPIICGILAVALTVLVSGPAAAQQSYAPDGGWNDGWSPADGWNDGDGWGAAGVSVPPPPADWNRQEVAHMPALGLAPPVAFAPQPPTLAPPIVAPTVDLDAAAYGPVVEPPLHADLAAFNILPLPVAEGTTQVEVGLNYARDTFGGHRMNYWEAPEVLVRRGVFDWLEARIRWGYNINDIRTDDEDDQFHTAYGSDDLRFAFKLLLWEQAGLLPTTALLPSMSIPTGVDEFNGDGVLLGLNLLYAWENANGLTLGGNADWQADTERDGNQYLAFSHSTYLRKQWNHRLATFGEFYLTAPIQSEQTRAEYYLQGGLYYNLRRNLQLWTRYGFGLNRASDDHAVAVGAAARF